MSAIRNYCQISITSFLTRISLGLFSQTTQPELIQTDDSIIGV